MLRIGLAMLVAWAVVCATAFAASPDATADTVETPEQILNEAMRQSIGGPARAAIGDQAIERVPDGLILIPRGPGAKVLVAGNKPVPPDFHALLIGADGMDAPAVIRLVPAGFIDADAALAWTPDDILASLRDTVERLNPDRVEQGLQEHEARRWVQPPRYNPQTHQISWAALILPKSAPTESDGEITWHAIGFGREGYIELTAVTSEQKAGVIGRMAQDFLGGLTFQPGKAYADATPADRRAPAGLAGAMGIDALHKAPSSSNFWASDTVFPIVGGLCAAIGAFSLFIYIQRHLRREARRG